VVRFHLAPRIFLWLAIAGPSETFGPDRPDALAEGSPTLPPMKALRRGLIVAAIAVLVGGFVKLRGKGGVPPTSGGWRELDGPDFR
jgi:hypothetical protein